LTCEYFGKSLFFTAEKWHLPLKAIAYIILLGHPTVNIGWESRLFNDNRSEGQWLQVTTKVIKLVRQRYFSLKPAEKKCRKELVQSSAVLVLNIFSPTRIILNFFFHAPF